MKAILQKESPVLREIAKDVKEGDFNSSKLKKIIKEMKEALDSQEDGVAIAAPQIGYSLRIFVISQKFTSNGEYMVCINPKLTKLSKDKKEMDEGCLSVRSFYGKVPRSNKATIEAFDETGKKFIRGASGLISQVFQHEMDHLNGILFIDKAKEIEQIINDPISRQNKSKKWKR